MSELLKQLDTFLFFLLNRDIQNTLFDIIMPVISGRSYIIILPFLVLFLTKERGKGMIILALSVISVLAADSSGNALKHLIGRTRPCNALENVHLLYGCSKSFSMPSNHSVNAFAFVTPFFVMTKDRVKYPFLLVAALVAVSRVYVGVHYPFDVTAGAALGILCALAVICIYRWAERRFAYRPYTTAMAVFLLGISIFRVYYILYGPVDLNPEEAHYWEWSRRLDLSYYSKGPMIAALIAIATSLFGSDVFGVRISAVVFSLMSSMVIYRLGKEMHDEKTGVFSAIVFQIIPLYSAFGVIFTTDSPFIFFWILSLYLFWKAISGQDALVAGHALPEKINPVSLPPVIRSSPLKCWIFLGVSIGLGLLTKYTMAFFYICALSFFMFTPQYKKLLKNVYPYIALLISLIIFSPVIIWNAHHGWVTIYHVAWQANLTDGISASARDFFEFAGSQFGVITPILFTLIIIAILKPAKTKEEKKSLIHDRFIFWFSVPVLVFFSLKSVQGKVQANWAIAGYITGIIAFSWIFLSAWKNHNPFLKGTVITALTLSAVITGIAYYPPDFIPLKFDLTSKLRGWEELGGEVSSVYEDMRRKGNVFIFSDRYQISSELAFYVKGHPVTYAITIDNRMNQYNLWPGFDNFVHYNAIFVTIDNVNLPLQIKNAFENSEKRAYKVYERGILLREFSIFICRDFKGIRQEKTAHY